MLYYKKSISWNVSVNAEKYEINFNNTIYGAKLLNLLQFKVSIQNHSFSHK